MPQPPLLRVSHVATSSLPPHDTCTICIEEYPASFDILSDFPIRLPCPGRHVAGAQCMLEYMRSGRATCPMCRFTFEQADYSGPINAEEVEEQEHLILNPRLERPYRITEWREYNEAHGGAQSSDEGDDEDLGYILGGDSDSDDGNSDIISGDEEDITIGDDTLTVIQGYQVVRGEHGTEIRSLDLQPVAMRGFGGST